jgi:hypothetical protein
MKKKVIRYTVIFDGLYSNIAKVETNHPNDSDYFKTYREAKQALIQRAIERIGELKDMLKQVRKTKQKEITLYEESDLYEGTL